MDYKRGKLGGEGFSLTWGLLIRRATAGVVKDYTSVLWGLWVNLV